MYADCSMQCRRAKVSVSLEIAHHTGNSKSSQGFIESEMSRT